MTIFVGGIHGVGKTYLGAPAAKSLGLRHTTASQLIREERGLQSWGEDKRVDGIDQNQIALIAATTRLLGSGQRLLLDGHFVLREAQGSFTRIDVQVFRELRLSALLLLDADIDVVMDRLKNRGDHSWSRSELLQLAEYEQGHARQVADELSLPLKCLVSPTHDEFVAALMSVIGP